MMTIIRNTAPVWPHSSIEDLADLEKTPLLAEPPPHITNYDTRRQENHIPDVNPWQLLHLRCVTQPLAMIPIKWNRKHSIVGTSDLPTRWPIGSLGVLRGILLRCIFVAVARMPLGVCTAIFFSSPKFTMVMSYIILQDHCGIWRYLVATILLAGVMALSRPPSLSPAALDTANIGLHTIIYF